MLSHVVTALDNFRLYDDAPESGVEETSQSCSIILSGRKLTLTGFSSPTLKIYDSTGREVLSANAAEAGLDPMPAGIYVATASDSTHQVSRKITLK